jgi:lysophospholipase L1-like esterase
MSPSSWWGSAPARGASFIAANQVVLYPDLFAGVGPDLRQADGVHPSAAGASVIARGLAGVVAEALRKDAV